MLWIEVVFQPYPSRSVCFLIVAARFCYRFRFSELDLKGSISFGGSVCLCWWFRPVNCLYVEHLAKFIFEGVLIGEGMMRCLLKPWLFSQACLNVVIVDAGP